ncbi:hypothetical protein BC455_15010 [Vibrio harveyi]|uniref:hypothetical protein n=1 Tax=Vibrio harveyi TaxID=669 RepID=UPI000841C7CF|nr:hypothetical protein [Vibrio harveyi]ODM58053.1 hypothetical protein BC455_15010 [Vibrio harveyi]
MKILVLGNICSGKTSFSKLLAKKYKITLYHLDAEFWKEGWIMPNKEDWEKRIQYITEEKYWIMDGNYPASLDHRVEHASHIFYIRANKYKCLYRYLRRIIIKKRKPGSDIPYGCSDTFSIRNIKSIWSYEKKIEHDIIGKISNHPNVKFID